MREGKKRKRRFAPFTTFLIYYLCTPVLSVPTSSTLLPPVGNRSRDEWVLRETSLSLLLRAQPSRNWVTAGESPVHGYLDRILTKY